MSLITPRLSESSSQVVVSAQKHGIETLGKGCMKGAEKENHTPKPRMIYLDVLRGVAALVVTVIHILETAYHDSFYRVQSIFNGGQFGVLLFFIISGLVITASILRSDSIKSFWVGRFWRLFPLYWTSLILSAGLFFVFPHHLNFEMYGNLKERFFSSFLVNATMLQHFLGFKHFVVAYWTLSFEMLFYLVLTSLALFKKAEKAYWGVWLVTAYLFASAIAGLALKRHFGFLNPSLFGFFCLGVWTYRQTKGLVSVASYLRTVGLFTIGLLFAWGVNSYAMPSEQMMAQVKGAVSPVGNLTAYLLAIGVFLWAHFSNRQKWPRFLKQLGVVSYSLYLAHTIAIRVVGEVFVPNRSPLPFIIGTACLTAIMTWLGYHLVEEPCIRKIEKLKSRPRPLPTHQPTDVKEQTQVA
jgi:peptidoglycan/LPS O-acetylase OafA/YrhL